MSRILVTGAGGFLGRYAVESLTTAGWTVIGAGRSAPMVDGLDDSLSGDLLEPQSAQLLVQRARADVLLHLAWVDHPHLRWHSSDNVAWAAATLNLAQSFAHAGGKRIVFGSSCAVYNFNARKLHTETDTLAPGSLYGAAKAATGELLRAAQQALDISVAEARIFFCFGAGEAVPRLVPELISGLSRGEKVACTDGKQKRDYLHAADVGQALQLLCASQISGPVNVASGVALPVSALITEIARQMGQPNLPNLGAISRPPTDPDEITADCSRLQTLGFVPHHNLVSGVSETLAKCTIG